MSITFTRLGSGNWGVKVDVEGDNAASFQPGQQVKVEKKSGDTKVVTLGQLIDESGTTARYQIEEEKPKADEETTLLVVAKLTKLEAEDRLSGFTQGVLDRYRKLGIVSPAHAAVLLKDLPDAKVVPAGRYAVDTPDGKLLLLRVWRKGSRVNVYDDDTGEYLRNKHDLLRMIVDQDPGQCWRRYGQLRKKCPRCAAKLSNNLSVFLLTGPQCLKYILGEDRAKAIVRKARDELRLKGIDPYETPKSDAAEPDSVWVTG